MISFGEVHIKTDCSPLLHTLMYFVCSLKTGVTFVDN